MSCYFCSQNTREIDFRDIETLRKFISVGMKIKPKKKTNLCSFHQRKMSQAVKTAKQLALLPYLPY
ncbi:MAG: 30S ribosomal protein S18 [Patescibacteria group bacterium]|nr:30S ribosomal protein S18 [Patescibacteria group bacterium]